jgi:hypothetical protein
MEVHNLFWYNGLHIGIYTQGIFITKSLQKKYSMGRNIVTTGFHYSFGGKYCFILRSKRAK